MKKRKSPVVLITVLVIMLVAVGIIYSPRTANQEHAMAQPPPPTAEKGERPKISANEVASMASSSMSNKQAPNRSLPDEATSGPSIAVPQQTTSKPTPNDSTTSTQWYTNETKK